MPTINEYMQEYVNWMQSYLDRGFEVTFLSLMFNPLPESQHVKKVMMEEAIYDCYRKAVKAMFRRPRSVGIQDLPFWVTSYDRPVWKGDHKMKRDHLANIAINDGLHLHAMCLTPPNTRLGMPFELHLHDHQSRYAPKDGPINRIHASTVAEENVKKTARYALKSIERRRIGVGDAIILPKSHSEFSRLGKNETPRDAAQRRMFDFCAETDAN